MSTLTRMQLAALREAERIEIGQDARVATGMLKEPMREQVLLRDDFAAIVRLIDLIQGDAVVLDRLQKAGNRPYGPEPASIEDEASE
jgi:hypothetical protein